MPSETWITQIGGVLKPGHAFLWILACILHKVRNYNLKVKHVFFFKCDYALLDVEALQRLN